jgi:hypothetical protein
MNPKLSYRPTGLNRRARTDGGLTQADAVKAVEARLDTIKTDVLASLDTLIEEMFTEKPALAADIGAACGRLYALSSQVVGVAGPFCPPEVPGAAVSLCELIENMGASGKWSAGSVIVHLDSLKLLRSMPDDEEKAARQKIFNGLRRIASQADPKAAV